jgi:hypothetical protein
MTKRRSAPRKRTRSEPGVRTGASRTRLRRNLGRKPAAQDLGDSILGAEILAPNIATLCRANPNAPLIVRAFDLKQGLLLGFVVHAQGNAGPGAKLRSLELTATLGGKRTLAAGH